MATLTLRPSSDNTLAHSLSSGSTGYSLISEASADDDSTYIYQEIDSTNTTTKASVFAVSGDIPNQRYVISGVTATVRVKTTASNGLSSITYGARKTTAGTNQANISPSIYTDYDTFTTSSSTAWNGTYEAGVAPEIYLSVSTSGYKGSKKSSSREIRVTQAYATITHTLVPLYNTIAISDSLTDVSVTSTQTYKGDSCTWTATPHTGCRFIGWYSDSSYSTLVTTDRTITESPTADRTLYALSEWIMYDFDVVATGMTYTASVSTNTAHYGDTVTWSISISDGEFQGWYSDKDLTNMVSSNQTYSLSVTDYGLVLRPKVLTGRQYTCKAIAKSNIVAATVTNENPDEYDKVTFSCTVTNKCEFVGWYSDPEMINLVSTEKTYVYYVERDLTLYAFAEQAVYHFEVAQPYYGSATVSTATQSMGENVTYSCSFGVSYEFAGWYSDSNYGGLVSSDQTYTFKAEKSLKLYPLVIDPNAEVAITVQSVATTTHCSNIQVVAVLRNQMTDSDWTNFYSGSWYSIDSSKVYYINSVAGTQNDGAYSFDFKLLATGACVVGFKGTCDANYDVVFSKTNYGITDYSYNPTAQVEAEILPTKGNITYMNGIYRSETVYVYVGDVIQHVAVAKGEVTSVLAERSSATPAEKVTYTATIPRWVDFVGWYKDSNCTQLESTDNPYERLITGQDITASSGVYITRLYALGKNKDIPEPIINVISVDRDKISTTLGINRVTAIFVANVDLQSWEARAELTDERQGNRSGILVEYGGDLEEGEHGYVFVDYDELTNGDGEYTVDVYGENDLGVWSSGQ